MMMSKFAADARPAAHGPIATTDATRTHEGGAGWLREPKGELFLLAVTNLVGEDTFYEGASARDARYRDLLARVTADDPAWVARMLPWLRNEAQLRTAAVVGAVEYLRAGGPDRRAVLATTLARADEPAEALAYWLGRYGKPLPHALKRGLGDAIARLYTERSALRYDSRRHAVRMGDVIALSESKPRDERQAALYRYLLDRRHGRDPRPETLEALPRVADALAYAAGETDDQTKAGSWERASARGAVDWAAQINSGGLGYMATLRNLRNFDAANLDAETIARVIAKLVDPDEVVRSRQLPFRFLSAWRALASMRWGDALERALELSLANVPALAGRTLVLWDCSGSMRGLGLSARSEVDRYEVAGVFALALARRAESADVVAYSNQGVRVPVGGATSILRTIDAIASDRRLWAGTDTFGCLAATYDGHDRVVIVTDEQAHPPGAGGGGYLSRPWRPGFTSGEPRPAPADVLARVPLTYTWNVAGYAPAHLPADGRSVTLGGLNDRAFAVIELLERGRRADWPF